MLESSGSTWRAGMPPVGQLPMSAGPWAQGLHDHPAPSSPDLDPDGLDLPLASLMRFRGWMAQQGHAVQVPRMCFDAAYAFDRIAVAHAAGPDRLRRLALELFQAYHRRAEARPFGSVREADGSVD